MNLKQYHAQLNEWKTKYGIPHQKYSSISYKPNLIEAVRCCVKCRKERSSMNRHHKCSDFTFALIRPDIYALRYMEFRKEDWDWLCRNCHRRYHNWVKPKLREMYAELNGMQALEVKIRVDWCIIHRAKIHGFYLEWLKKPYPSKKKNAKISKR